ncbi:MAG TPA: PilZ domain-containing protein [Thermoanaerobaculia bacterium]|nr:PilZ domain-containing protein [Thermoanaerobaculia bacterium]
MSSYFRERRRLQRIRFPQPLSGRTSQGSLSILDMSLGGVSVEHPYPFAAGRPVRLEFVWNGRTVALHCDVVRCRLVRSSVNGSVTYSSGLRFSQSVAESALTPREMVLQLVTRSLRERPTASYGS